MTGEEKKTLPAEEANRSEFKLDYAGVSGVSTDEGGITTVGLVGNGCRDRVQANGVIKDPIAFREALSALQAVVASDYRYVPKDRTAYMAYQRLKKSSAGSTTAQAQQAYFDWLARNDPMAWFILDPIVSVHPDEVFFEVFSKDEGTYAKLSASRKAIKLSGDVTCGTTNIDFSDALYQQIQRMRSNRKTCLSVSPEGVAVSTEEVGEQVEKKISVPNSWLRGFLQIQSAAALAADTFTIAPIDLYNVLRHLRLNADQKRKRRGLRVELLPGERPRIVLEPWETVIETTAEPYKGKVAKVVRVWGRRRLMLLRRLLPFVESVDIHLLGSGLPSFWILRAGDLNLTLGMSGFTSANWSQALNFDLLLPRGGAEARSDLDKVLSHLGKKWFGTSASIGKATKLKGADLTQALQRGSQEGQIMFDLASGVMRLRPLVSDALELEKLEYRNDQERVAHDLLARKGAVSIATENRIHGSGIELVGKVLVAEDKREYRPSFLLGEEGRVLRAECTCTFYRKHGLKVGPCPHLIALRLAYGRAEEKRRQGRGKARKTTTMETRTYSKRRPQGEEIFQITLEKKRLNIRWGERGTNLRVQRLTFNSVADARQAYFARVDELEAKGYLDASAG